MKQNTHIEGIFFIKVALLKGKLDTLLFSPVEAVIHRAMWSVDTPSSWVTSLFCRSQSCAHSLLIHATSFCYQVNAASFQRERMLIKLVGHTLEHLLRSSGCTFPDHSLERKQPVDQWESASEAARAAQFFLISSLLGNITLLCSSRPLIPFWTHKKEIINQEKEVLVEYYEWFISYFVNKIETIRAAEQTSTSNHFFH